MPPKIGPTGDFPLGQPQHAGDRGGLYVAFIILKQQRQVAANFGTVLTYVQSSLPETAEMVKYLRQRIHATWGLLPYNKAELPLGVEIVTGSSPDIKLVRITFHRPVEVLVANPELWLSLCEVIEDRVSAAGLRL